MTKFLKELDKVEVVLIGGCSGTGKSTLANILCNRYGFHHRSGSGFIREICRSFISTEENEYLHAYSYETGLDYSGYDLLTKQSEPMVRPIEMCIDRAVKEGTKIVVEGVNILPKLYSHMEGILGIILENKSETLHRNMCKGESHRLREFNEGQFKNTREIQKSFIEDAIVSDWSIVQTASISKGGI